MVGDITETTLTIDVTFENKKQISTQAFDYMDVNFKRTDLFWIGKDGVEAEELVGMPPMVVRVPRQVSQEKIESIESTSTTISNFMQASSLINIGATIFAQQSLQPLWGAISSLQLTVHIPMNNVMFPDSVSIVFDSLKDFVTFDLLEGFQELGLELEYDVTPTMYYNDGFDRLGYDSSEPIGLLGTVNFFIAIMIVKLIWNKIPRCCCENYCGARQTGDQMSSTVIRFIIELGFELLITVGAVFYPRDDPTLLDNEEKTNLDMFCILYTIMLGIAMLAYLALTVNVTCRKGSAITKIEQEILLL